MTGPATRLLGARGVQLAERLGQLVEARDRARALLRREARDKLGQRRRGRAAVAFEPGDELRIEVTAAEPVSALQLSAESTSLILAPASAMLALASAGAPVTHELIATSQQEGLAELTVRLKAGEGAEAVYAVPVLVSAAGSAPAPAAGG